jgi:hypothetical protein
MFNWLRKNIRLNEMDDNLSSAFSRIKEELAVQRKVIGELYGHHHDFKSSTIVNHKRIAEWITYFDKSVKRLENDLTVLERKIHDEFETISNASLGLFRDAYSKNIKDSDALKKEILKEVEVFLAQNKNKTPIINVDNVSNVKNVMPETSFDALSNPEKWLAGVLFNTETPFSYSQIAEKTGKTVNTVRVYMNQLKLKGFIDESTLPNGTKIFSLRHKAKVKKLYNL